MDGEGILSIWIIGCERWELGIRKAGEGGRETRMEGELRREEEKSTRKWEGITSVHGLIGGYFPCSYFGKYPEFC